MLHFRGGRAGDQRRRSTPTSRRSDADLAAAYRAEIADLAARGCRYLQLDDTNLAYLCDDADPRRDPGARRRSGRAAAPLLPPDQRGDRAAGPPTWRSASISAAATTRAPGSAQGGYEPVAEILFNELAVDGFFLEYDDARSGDFAPLRFVPKGKTVVLGIMTSKRPELESKDALKRRIDEAARYVAARPALRSAHQCGFSSTVHGNELDRGRPVAASSPGSSRSPRRSGLAELLPISP